MTRWLAVAVAVAVVLWSGWWFVGSYGVRRGVEGAAADLRAGGWDVAWDDLSMAGFPNRFDLTVDAPRATDPTGAWTVSAPFVQVFALSYRLNHVIAVAPDTITVDGPAGEVVVTDDDLRASAVVAPGPDLALTRATVAGEGIGIEWQGRTVGVGAAQWALRLGEGARAYDVALGAERIALPPAIRELVDPDGRMPDVVGALTGRGTAILDRPLDRHLAGPVGVEALTLEDAALRWGDVSLRLRGTLTADAAGRAEGALEVNVGDVDRLMDLVEPYLPQGQARLVRTLAAAAVAGAPGGWLPLPVERGAVRFGPLTVAMLPVMDPPE